MNYFKTESRNSYEDKFIKKAIKSNSELLEHLESTIRWLLHYCEKNHIQPPNENQLRRSVERTQELLRKMPTEYQPTDNTHKNQPNGNQNPQAVTL